MNVWNKVLMALITIECVVFGIFAANRYNVTKTETAKIEKLESDLAQTLEAVQKLRCELYGGFEAVESWTDQGLIGQLEYMRRLQNGEAFMNCLPTSANVDAQTQQASVAFSVSEQDKTTAFRPGSIAYVFDAGSPVAAAPAADETAQASVAAPYTFLGAFAVAGATATQVNLTSVGAASAEEIKALQDSARSGNSWVVYADRLPIDSPDDVALFASENAEFVAALSDESRAFCSKTLTVDESVLASDDSVRLPVDFQGSLDYQWSVRDRENIVSARRTSAIATLSNVIADQIVAIGDEPTDQKILDLDNWDAIYAAAVARKRVDSWRENIATTRAALGRMNSYCDLAKKILDAAEDGVAACEKAIAQKLAENDDLASKIAWAQFAAYEKLNAQSQTAANN
ncbi:MAG: hypothetical protein ACI4NP_03145 [Thermoguttaceae bacterium]